MDLNLSREETIANHRKMWNWIAYETLKRKRRVLKEEYFEEHGISILPDCNCYCCDYDNNNYNGLYGSGTYCSACPVVWPDDKLCAEDDSLYNQFNHAINYQEAAELARQIAELPEVPTRRR